MSYAIYNYIQSICFPHSSSPQLEQVIREIREFFSQRRLIYLNDSSLTNDSYLFLSLSQLVWHPTAQTSFSNHLRPYFYQIPVSIQKNFKSFFLDLLQIKLQIDGKDLINLIEQIRKKYGTKPIDKDDFTLLQNIYSLLVEHYSNVFNSNINLYLPNIDGVLHPGSTLFFCPFERDQSSKKMFLFQRKLSRSDVDLKYREN